MTCEMPVTSMPRAAMSVATSTRARPLRNCSSAFCRAGWLLLPCSALTRTPPVSRPSATRSAERLVRVKTITRDNAGSASSSTQQRPLAGGVHVVTYCAIGSSAGAVYRHVHPHRIAQQRLCELADLRRHGGRKQAADWRCAGRAATMRRMSRMKPRSSMRSASSSTNWLTGSDAIRQWTAGRRCGRACPLRCRRRRACAAPARSG